MIQIGSLMKEKWNKLCEQEVASGYDSLSQNEKVWFTTRSLIDSIEGGGLISYFYNHDADHWPDCLVSLELLQSIQIKSIIMMVADLFVNGVPTSIDSRNAQIELWDDECDDLLSSADESLMPLMNSLELKLSQFITDNLLEA